MTKGASVVPARTFATLVAALLPVVAWGQPQRPTTDVSKASIVILDHVTSLHVGHRGRVERTEAVRVELRDDAAVTAFGQLMFPYLPSTSA